MTCVNGIAIETFEQEVISRSALGEALLEVFEENKEVKRTLHIAEDYVRKNSSYEIAQRFMELFESLPVITEHRSAA